MREISPSAQYCLFSFDAMFTALAAFPEERVVIQKERASGSYRLSAYFLAKTTSDMPVRILLPLSYMVISYWMANVDSRFKIFVGSVGCSLLSVVAGEAIGLCLGATIYDLQRAITVMTVGALFLMLVGGFFAENPPDWIDWAKFLSPFKYSFDSSLQLIFSRDVPCDGSGSLESLCGGRNTLSRRCSGIHWHPGKPWFQHWSLAGDLLRSSSDRIHGIAPTQGRRKIIRQLITS